MPLEEKPLSEVSVEEVRQVMTRLEASPVEGTPWISGDRFRIKEGPFLGMSGRIDSVDLARKVVLTTVQVFGRDTPLSLSFLDIEPE